jgi:hypothetical protein
MTVGLPALIGLAVEQWRLASWLEAVRAPAGTVAAVRHSTRKIEDFLKACDLEVRAMNGHPFDAGLAVEVVDTVDDPALPVGHSIVAETLSPMILWRGTVVKAAEVVTRRGTRK